MSPQISRAEHDFAERQKAELQAWIDKKTDKGFRSRAESKPALIDELLQRWETGQPFYISAVVGAPYDGCFHEPNLFLCTPTGCELFGELNRHDVQGNRAVWGLYASGQGMCVDCLASLSDVVKWLADQSISELATREEGRTSEHRRHHYGSFDSFELHDFGPIDKLPAAETYWASAVRAAEELYGLALPWTCVQCGTVKLGTGESLMEPIHTGYRGNGGVGVFMEGALCEECYEAGACALCRKLSQHPWDSYSPEVAEHGADLCDSCTHDLFRGTIFCADEGVLDRKALVAIRLESDELVACDENGVPLQGVRINTPAVDKVLRRWRLRLEDVFEGRGALVLGPSLACMAEAEEDG
jgi:hypothetical protein